jgi:acyl-CoA synthetase (NDP forming)
MSRKAIDDVLHARSVAVVGATRSEGWGGGGFVAGLTQFGFPGKVYPVNPKYPEILGLKAYQSLGDIPEPVDYVISSIPAKDVMDMLEQAAEKKVKTVHLFTARLSETGRPDAMALEKSILDFAKKAGIRLIGPNCMGVYYPRGGIAFHADFPKESGPVGLISQSGMLAREIVLAAPLRGVYFSKVFSYGNAVDLNETDFLEYLTDDPETAVIMMYIEGIKGGRRFLDVLKKATEAKPVVILKGGRGEAGSRATASHTASLAGASRTWDAMVAQGRAVAAESVEELLDLAAAFRFLPRIEGRRVGVAGGAGGSSVMAADQCEQAGLDVIPLPGPFRDELRRRGVSVWDWLSNPADISIREDESFSVGLILEMMARDPNFDVLVAMMGMPGRPPQQGSASPEDVIRQQYHLDAARSKPFLAVVPDKSLRVIDMEARDWKALCETRSALIKLEVPFFPTIGRAARAARKVSDYFARGDGRGDGRLRRTFAAPKTVTGSD